MAVHNLLTTLQNGARARIRSIPLPYTKAALGISNILLQHGFVHNVTRGTTQGPSPSDFLKASVASKKLWVDIKYAIDERPVMNHALVVSKPSRKISMGAKDLLRLITGRRAKFVAPLELGEIAIVRHSSGEGGVEWIEAREAVGRGVGGEVIARIR